MKGNVSVWRCRLARLVALAVIIALCPLPVLAAGQGQAAQAPGIRASAAKIVKSQPLAAKAATQTSTASGTDSPSFFKTPAGVAVLAVIAAGVGYAVYSTQNDRITSPAKK